MIWFLVRIVECLVAVLFEMDGLLFTFKAKTEKMPQNFHSFKKTPTQFIWCFVGFSHFLITTSSLFENYWKVYYPEESASLDDFTRAFQLMYEDMLYLAYESSCSFNVYPINVEEKLYQNIEILNRVSCHIDFKCVISLRVLTKVWINS